MAALLAGAAGAGGAEARFVGGPERVSLIELYTSEGCSSCPRADRWIGALRDNPRLWREFVPVSFHVNYWDRLGWPDRFASRQFTERQYAHASAWGTGSVYTPCFVRDGAEWRPEGGTPSAVDGAPGVLTVTIGADGAAAVDFAPAGGRGGPYLAHLAILGSGFVSRVTAGENGGSTLRHEFVALALADRVLAADASGSGFATRFPLPKPQVGDAPRTAIAAWVTRGGDLRPIQAAGGWLGSSL